ncbi:hypothetical protein K450DRAFT_227659 [Umbelopsis ramanniana AG]|uniref:Uncharacterized protein n=1 Tax=Umbelopsis ramanniana AG TaxID=1314678 RepID=A0AAD5HGV1_UMBRA|nr:uncharacterized protein K450DRAFT_227659 [Umbelopsis ramanniana AG]KAI8582539.1 hypothetical protein K450DRAFT_227659 [Umbelopsis ramanniana AG]
MFQSVQMNQRTSITAFCNIKRTLSTKPIINRPPLTPKQNEVIQNNQDILSSYMVPGKLKKFFKSRPTRSQVVETETISSPSTTFRAARPRKLTEQRFSDPPSIAQQQLAQRIERAILKMNASEALPSRFVTPEHIRVVGVKALSNLQKCHVYWRPCGDAKQTDQTKQALKTYQPVLTRLIQNHAHMRRPVAIKYIEDRDGEELESIFKQLSQEEQEPENSLKSQ